MPVNQQAEFREFQTFKSQSMKSFRKQLILKSFENHAKWYPNCLWYVQSEFTKSTFLKFRGQKRRWEVTGSFGNLTQDSLMNLEQFDIHLKGARRRGWARRSKNYLKIGFCVGSKCVGLVKIKETEVLNNIKMCKIV